MQLLSLSCSGGRFLSVTNFTSEQNINVCDAADGRQRTLRVTVAHADGSHTSKQVQVSPAVHVPQPLHVSLVDEQWSLVVGDFHSHGVTVLPANLHHALFGHSLNTEINGVKRCNDRGSQYFLRNSCK